MMEGLGMTFQPQQLPTNMSQNNELYAQIEVDGEVCGVMELGYRGMKLTCRLIMALSTFFIRKLLNLPSYYAASLILVGCLPGDEITALEVWYNGKPYCILHLLLIFLGSETKAS
ncbi:Double-stranded RNA-binding [Artemisia annua]|uniref:Double-stranded RNA-binding n=1 Tax=Artemisia annua TaxID=35608 RepID=A0A2U1P423_ARTAN|nr:Double-stranded RNA-binding [Artemisia annua]